MTGEPGNIDGENVNGGKSSENSEPSYSSPPEDRDQSSTANVSSTDAVEMQSHENTKEYLERLRKSFGELELKERIKILLDFSRIKIRELNTRHTQLARVFLIFFILDIVLFLTIFETRANIDLKIPDLLSIDVIAPTGSGAISITGETRPIFVFTLGSALLIFFLRFGYLYYQGTRDVINMHSAISTFLPQWDNEPLEFKYIRRGLVQSCKINYIVQTLTVFAFPRKEILSDEGRRIFYEERLPYFDAGPLADPIGYGAHAKHWELLTRACMLAIIFGVAILIAIAQIMVILIASSVFNYVVSWIIFLIFVFFYFVYGRFIFLITRGTGDWKNGFLGKSTYIVLPVAWILIILSFSSNFMLLINIKEVSDIPVLSQKVSKSEIIDNSPPTFLYLNLLLRDGAI